MRFHVIFLSAFNHFFGSMPPQNDPRPAPISLVSEPPYPIWVQELALISAGESRYQTLFLEKRAKFHSEMAEYLSAKIHAYKNDTLGIRKPESRIIFKRRPG